MSGIVERLRDGVHEDGMHDDNSTSLFDIDDANEVMCEAADTITDLLAAFENFDNTFCAFDPTCMHSHFEMRKALIGARAAISKAKGN